MTEQEYEIWVDNQDPSNFMELRFVDRAATRKEAREIATYLLKCDVADSVRIYKNQKRVDFFTKDFYL